MQFGKHGNGLSEFDQPRAVKCDNTTGLIYIVDTNNSRIQVWDESLKYLSQFGKGILHYPRGIVIAEGMIFVTDYFKEFLYKFSRPDLSLIKTQGHTSQLKLNNPTAIDAENNEIFVLEADKQRILVFTDNLEYLKTLAKGIIHVSYDIQVCHGIIHVLEVDTNLIKLLNSQNGELVASVLTNHDSIPFSNACHFSLAVDTKHYFITDWKLNKVKVISNTGVFIRIIDTSEFECLHPRGITSLPNNGIIVSFEEGKNALVKLPDLISPD